VTTPEPVEHVERLRAAFSRSRRPRPPSAPGTDLLGVRPGCSCRPTDVRPRTTPSPEHALPQRRDQRPVSSRPWSCSSTPTRRPLPLPSAQHGLLSPPRLWSWPSDPTCPDVPADPAGTDLPLPPRRLASEWRCGARSHQARRVPRPSRRGRLGLDDHGGQVAVHRAGTAIWSGCRSYAFGASPQGLTQRPASRPRPRHRPGTAGSCARAGPRPSAARP